MERNFKKSLKHRDNRATTPMTNDKRNNKSDISSTISNINTNTRNVSLINNELNFVDDDEDEDTDE